MAFRVVRQRREARRQAKLDDIFMVGEQISFVILSVKKFNFTKLSKYQIFLMCAESEHSLYLLSQPPFLPQGYNIYVKSSNFSPQKIKLILWVF